MSPHLKSPIICLMGPTASGKTKLAIELIKHFPLEIVSVDSAMVYRGMDIGTAKPTPEELAQTPHRLINICNPEVSYSAGQFYADVTREIRQIHEMQRIPLLVGGTMLYFKWLQQGYEHLPKTDVHVREQIILRGEQLGWPILHQELNKIDAKTAAKIHINDAQRIQRALSLYESTGKTPSEWYALQATPSSLEAVLNLILIPKDRGLLHQTIAERLNKMLQDGFVEEVKQLYQRENIHAQLPAIKTVGYRQIWEYLSGNIDYETMQMQAIAATRQLARRQLIWLRRWPTGVHFNSQDPNLLQNIMGAITNFLNKNF